jgi:hypothetical protein
MTCGDGPWSCYELQYRDEGWEKYYVTSAAPVTIAAKKKQYTERMVASRATNALKIALGHWKDAPRSRESGPAGKKEPRAGNKEKRAANSTHASGSKDPSGELASGSAGPPAKPSPGVKLVGEGPSEDEDGPSSGGEDEDGSSSASQGGRSSDDGEAPLLKDNNLEVEDTRKLEQHRRASVRGLVLPAGLGIDKDHNVMMAGLAKPIAKIYPQRQNEGDKASMYIQCWAPGHRGCKKWAMNNKVLSMAHVLVHCFYFRYC